MLPESLVELLTGPWGLVLMCVLVLGDAFLVVVPGEIAVTALGALAVTAGSPPLWTVITLAGAAAWCGDLLCYLVGRQVGTTRWRWMRSPRVAAALEWAAGRLRTGTATVLFTARFVPFARLAVNLTAGATRVPLGAYAPLAALAALGWSAYQAAIGATVAALLPGGAIVAVPVSIAVALAVGALIDVFSSKVRRARSSSRSSG